MVAWEYRQRMSLVDVQQTSMRIESVYIGAQVSYERCDETTAHARERGT